MMVAEWAHTLTPLRHCPGHNVLSAQDGGVEFDVFVPFSMVYKPNETDILWMNNYYSAHPRHAKGMIWAQHTVALSRYWMAAVSYRHSFCM
jgi:hypothetical protein